MKRTPHVRRTSLARVACASAMVAALAGAGAGAAPALRAATAPTHAACSNSDVLSQWTTARLAMQTIAVPVQENAVNAVSTEVADGAGGVLLFGNTAPSDLGAQLKQLESHSPDQLGTLVMTDEEGGGVQRMANLVGNLPWAAWMGKHLSSVQIRRHVEPVAERMYRNGVNTDLAPVVDVDGRNVPPSSSNPDGWRSFSGTTKVVSVDGNAYAQGLADGGVIGVAKHFPGLGGSTGNTDSGPARTLPWSTLQRVAIPPFARAINGGVPAVMVSNAVVPGLTTKPASLSAKVIDGELKGKLGFKGLVMTDSLSAGAISGAGFSLGSASVSALQAGADMVMFGASPATTLSETLFIRNSIVRAVAAGTLHRARLIDAAGAVLNARHVDLCTPATGSTGLR